MLKSLDDSLIEIPDLLGVLDGQIAPADGTHFQIIGVAQRMLLLCIRYTTSGATESTNLL
jgi:hypothetical protein